MLPSLTRFVCLACSLILLASCTSTSVPYVYAIKSKSGCWIGSCENKLPIVTAQYDNLVVMKMPQPLYSYELESILASRVFFRHYQDKFDALYVIYNLEEQDFEAKGIDHWGKSIAVSNYAYGIGRERFTHSLHYGSQGRLKMVIQMSERNGLITGPSLHGFIHLWAAHNVLPTDYPEHWGFSSAHGQLGGFDRKNLKHLGDNRYSAGRFGLKGNFGNTIPYSPIEMYLAGWLPSGEVPDLLVAKNASFLMSDGQRVKDEDGNPIFTATDLQTVTIEDIITKLGPRNPPLETSRKHFQVAVVLLEDDEHVATPDTIKKLREQIELFSFIGDVRPEETATEFINFWTATGGRATLSMADLDSLRLEETL